MKRYSAFTWSVTAASIVILGGYAAVAVWVPVGETRTAFIDIFLCVLPLLVNGALLLNAITTDWRENAFWMLLALGCSLWLVGQSIWTYMEVYQHGSIPALFIGDIVFFLHTVPMIAALAMQPHKHHDGRKTLHRYVDFALMFCWWVFLYAFIVIPWQYIVVDGKRYIQSYNVVSGLENIVFVGGAAMLAVRATGRWRHIYALLSGAGATYILGLFLLEFSTGQNSFSRGSLSNLPLVVWLLWLAMAGIFAYRTRAEESVSAKNPQSETFTSDNPEDEAGWETPTARAALLSLPIMGLWCAMFSQAPLAVRDFRMTVAFAAVLPLGALAFLRHEMTNTERLRLLRASQESLNNLKRLQTQFVQSEKLASIGQLVGGAAHEINNPLTAILGYAELLADGPTVDVRSRDLAEKIRKQARRTRTLVNNLLSFARQVPSEQRTALDINTIINSSVQFRRIDLRGKNIRIEVQAGGAIPQVRGDANQLLQVFFNIINNAVDAMQEVGGGTLTVRTLFEKGNVVVLFSDSGPGIRDPHLVFDPFYTTKPVGKGTGLGLSICYGLVHDQGGTITCLNRPEGGATFRVELPAVAVAFPQLAGNPGSQGTPSKIA